MGQLKFFREISAKDVGIAGGKGASLGEMTRAKIPVPPGFVILASTFDRFLEETDLNVDVAAILRKINYKDINSVDRASNEIRGLIMESEMPTDIKVGALKFFDELGQKFVAVRSSATAEDSKVASWAGELESYLNTDKESLLLNVKKCWSSLYTPRAIFYRHEKKLTKTRISVAVVVQKMVQSEISGITFTVHPVTEDRNQMLIEAGWGLGEAIVSGSITPDAYVLNKKTLEILDVNVSKQLKMITKVGKVTKTVSVKKRVAGKQKLSGKQILALAKICGQVEKHYGFPCDIEWAYAKGKFYIVQSRPITTLK
ncbi:MAG: PEP/pyruvate-binding domain-containing protein [Patescibacteria group bacterium]